MIHLFHHLKLFCSFLISFVIAISLVNHLFGDGVMIRPITSYKGSVEEKSQEAIIIFKQKNDDQGSIEDLILKIQVEGNVEHFAWIIPFPNKPEIIKANARLFEELHQYVQHRIRANKQANNSFMGLAKTEKKGKIAILEKKLVGSYETTTVKEMVAGALNQWLMKNGFETVANVNDIIDYYRKKDYVFVCVKVSKAQLKKGQAVDLHPLRFRFFTGGYDGVYFPMKMTGLQKKTFDVSLYVFMKSWLNDDINRFGFMGKGMQLVWRDFDSAECEPNAGNLWSNPEKDPYLYNYSHYIPTVKKLFKKLYPGERFYLTELRANNFKPEEVRNWSNDLWLFPYYNDVFFEPYDARLGGVAHPDYPKNKLSRQELRIMIEENEIFISDSTMSIFILTAIVFIVVLVILSLFLIRLRKRKLFK